MTTAQPATPRYTLGVNINLHDSSAALLRDGVLIRLVEQEKVGRRKHALGQPPALAIQQCLAAESVSPGDLAAVAIGWDHRGSRFGQSRRFTPDGLRRMLFPDQPDLAMPPVTWVPHHLAHAASAYYPCPADPVAIIVIDGAGETQCSTIARGHGGAIEILREWPIAQSLGFFYAAASRWAGLSEWGAGKLMGLAAYGRPRGGLPLHRRPDGYELVVAGAPGDADDPGRRRPLLGFDPVYERLLYATFGCHYPYAERRGEEAIAYADFAATVQDALEEAVLGLAEQARRLVDSPVLVLAGGVGMNCSMVGRLVRSGLYDRVYVPPVPSDVGVSVGAALFEAERAGVRQQTRFDHAYWSLDVSADQAAAAAAGAGLVSRPLPEPELARQAAAALSAGQVVAWARGRGEIGQRALGARSILADPRDRRNHERLNLIKGREMWRPVAPSVLAEHLDEVMATPVGQPARFMLAAGVLRPELRARMPAVTHVDGSARPQEVVRDTNPAYWTLIEEFRQRTGVPAVVNTSFNLAGEPIVNTAGEAVETFVRAKDIDLLVLADRLVARGESDLPATAEAT
ncbi:carbamoyltransferase family protein [Micromonospora sp. CPCC 206061]|uniref:carbamoyltransferase family protein n=1 Tax=Micromonospora sp. CPCC 206061 TaxID=3122410 RepID=UPI002FF40E4F